MRIGLFGGSFNPPHVCHVLAATWAATTRDLDEVWFVPTHRHAFGKDLASFEDRCGLVEAAIAPLGPWARISRVEAELPGESRTVDTVSHLMRERPGDVFSLVLGADLLLEAHKWKRFDLLEQLVTFHVIGRGGFEVPGRRFALELPNVSSTELRAHLAARDLDFVRERIPRGVLDVILARGLYGSA